jgi:BirA family biotin operon repressor/biotin-[acetyl-CoA-carboxylase] ligase
MPFDIDAVRARVPGRRIDWFPSTDSTMSVAAQLARDGCASGTVAGADEQLAGVGRHGHSWHSQTDAGLYVSIVLRLPVDMGALPVVMLALGIATRQAIAQVTGLEADLRWPNDVMFGETKCAGILAQMESGAVVAGIGINVNHTSFPEGIAPTATSLKLQTSRAIPREDLLIALLHEIDVCCRILCDNGPDTIFRIFTRVSSYAQGRRVRVDQDGAMIEGVTAGLDPSGFLLVREDNGKKTTILAGGVRPA